MQAYNKCKKYLIICKKYYIFIYNQLKKNNMETTTKVNKSDYMENLVINTNEFRKKVYEINSNKFKKHKSAALGISAKYPEIYFVAHFSNDGDTLKNLSAYESYGKAKFYANKGNGWVILNAEMNL